MKRYEALLFDAGDTLVHLMPSAKCIFMQRCAEAGLTVSEAEAEAAERARHIFVGQQIRREQAGAPALSDDDWIKGMDAASVAALYGEGTFKKAEALSNVPWPKQHVETMPGAKQLLERLTDEGYRLALVSNWDATLPDTLKELGLDEYFELIVVSDIEGVRKPDPRILEIACERLGVTSADCLYIGDHPYDVLCAHKFGMKAMWLAPPEAELPDDAMGPADYRVSCYEEILEVLV